MSEILEPGGIARRLLLRRVFGTGIMVVLGSLSTPSDPPWVPAGVLAG
jgi:hypothetical protein